MDAANKKYARLAEFREFLEKFIRAEIANDEILTEATTFVKDGVIRIFDRGIIRNSNVVLNGVYYTYVYVVVDPNTNVSDIKTYKHVETIVYQTTDIVVGSKLLYMELKSDSILQELGLKKKDILRLGV